MKPLESLILTLICLGIGTSIGIFSLLVKIITEKIINRSKGE